MHVLFYAPLKSPCHRVASGDRLIARLLVGALEQTGVKVSLATSFRSFDSSGDRQRQLAIRDQGRSLARQIASGFQHAGADIWFTYHSYHKAPDWIGPTVSTALAIPYVIAEASVSPAQNHGPWHIGYAQSEFCARRADLIFSINPRDSTELARVRGGGAGIVDLPPFLDLAPLSERQSGDDHRHLVFESLALDPAVPLITAVAMMRGGDKLESYRRLCDALAVLEPDNWQAVFIGSGDAEAEVRSRAMDAAGGRIVFPGALESSRVYEIVQYARLSAWPAVNEAVGMAMLESLALGVPVVSGRSGSGVNLVKHGETGLVCDSGNARLFAAAMRRLLLDEQLAKAMGRTAAARVSKYHSLGAAAEILHSHLSHLQPRRAGARLLR